MDTINLVTTTYCGNSEYNGDFMCIPINCQYLAVLRARLAQARAMAEQDGEFSRLVYHDRSPRFYAWSEEGDEAMDGESVRLCDADPCSDQEPQRTELNECSVSCTDIWWSVTLRHTEVTVESAMVPVAMLDEIEKRLMR